MTLKIERVKSKVKTVSMQRNTAVFLAVLQNILTLREGFKKKKLEFSSFWEGGLRRRVYFPVFETEPDFRAIFDYFRRCFVIDFPVFGRGGGSDQNWKIPVFFFEPFPKPFLSQPFLIQMNWNFAWWLSRSKGSSSPTLKSTSNLTKTECGLIFSYIA